MHNVLVLRFSSLGDVVLSTTLLEAVRRAHPESRIWLATKHAYAPLFTTDRRVDHVVALEDVPGALRRLIAQLETVEFDLILDAHNSLRSRLVTALLPPARTVRLRKDSVARMLFVRARLRSRVLDRDLVDRYLDMLGDGLPRWRPWLALQAVDREAARRRLGGERGGLAVAPGARHAPKRWPVDRFAAVAREFQRRVGAPLVIVGGPGEEELCATVAAALDPPPVVMAGRQDLRVLAAVLAECRLLLCNDSGLMHLAEAVDTPVLAVFGPTSRELGFFPRDLHSRVVEHALACRPCSRTGARACHMPERWCMTRSTPSLVYGQLEVQWQRIQSNDPATST